MQNILTHLVAMQAERYGDSRIAMAAAGADGSFSQLTWADVASMTSRAASALCSLDIAPTDRIGIFSANRPEMVITDFAAYANRAIPVAIYATSSAEQVEYIVNDAGIKILFVGDGAQLAKALQIIDRCPSLGLVVGYRPAEEAVRLAEDGRVMTFDGLLAAGDAAAARCSPTVEERTMAATPADIATLIYTSGTTGEPKGAVLNHSCFDAALEEHRVRLTMLSDDDTSLSFLPLSHIFEKAWTYFCLWRSMKVTVNEDPRAIQRVIRQVRPTCMCSVPRFWEKVYAAVKERLGAMVAVKRMLAFRAIKVGARRNLEYVRRGKKVPPVLERRYRFYEKRVFMPLKKAVGIENGNIFPTAGAPLSPTIVRFFQACGIDIVIGYGLSETTATVTCFPRYNYEIGTVGTPLSCVAIKIGPNDEILVKGPTVMSGYYNKPEATAEAFTPQGWLRTGDAGRIDAQGALILTERLKDLFKTSNGKYIAPQALESRLGEDPLIEQVAVIADKRKYVTAIIVPAFDALKEYADKKKITYDSIEDLVKNPEIEKMIAERIEKLQTGLAAFEKIKRFTLLPAPLTMENGELTNTLKIRRPVINARYADVIDAMYQ